MSSILQTLARFFLGTRAAKYENVHADEIFPTHFIDNTPTIRACIVNYTFRYQAVLDASKLRESLVTLLDVGDWRKLRGRLRANRSGQYEIHVPSVHTVERPAIRFSHTTLDVGIEEHPLACQLPCDTAGLPVVTKGFHSFSQFSASSDQPLDLKTYLTTDEPLISLHITSFKEATLVAINFPHVIADVTATAALLSAWSRVASGELNQVPPLFGAREDVLGPNSTASSDKYPTPFVLEYMLVSGLSMAKFAMRHIWDLFMTPTVHDGFIFLPTSFIQQLRRHAEEELRNRKDPSRPSFLSDGDLIIAWGSRMVFLSRSKTRSAVIINVFNVRTRLSRPLIDPAGAYIQNLIMASSTILPSGVGAGESTGQIAIRVREALAAQTTEEQVLSLARLGRANGGGMPLFGLADSMVVPWTNWCKAQIAEKAAGLGSAVAGPSDGKAGSASKHKFLTHWGAGINMANGYRDGFVIYAKTVDGGYWLHGWLRAETWDMIRSEIEQFSSRT